MGSLRCSETPSARMGSTSSIAAACARPHPPASADTNTWLVGAICVAILYLFEKQVDNQGDIKYWYWKIRSYGLVVLMAMAGVELVKASVYLPAIPASSLALTNGHLVDTLWIICVVVRAKDCLSELAQLCDKQLGHLRIEDVNKTALFVFMMCADCASLGFWLVIAVITKGAMSHLLSHLRMSHTLDELLRMLIGIPLMWRYCQVAIALSQGWHPHPLGMAATVALTIRIIDELREFMTRVDKVVH